MNTVDKIKNNIKNGDVLLSFNRKSFVSDAIADLTNSKFSHSFLYIGKDKIVESGKKGVVIDSLDQYLNYDKYYLALSRPVDDEKLAKELVNFCLSKVGIRYAYLQIAWLGLLYFLKINKSKRLYVDFPGIICSELIAMGMEHIKRYPFAPKIPAHVTPEDCAQKFKRIV